MTKRVLGGPAASGEIDCFLRCSEHARGSVGAYRPIIDEPREAIGISGICPVTPPRSSADAAGQAVAENPLLAADDETISQLVDDLAAAYASARETGDDAGVEIYGKALETIGRSLALEIGPKAAGIKLS